MIEMVLASRNQKKIAELETLLRQYSSNAVKLLSLDDIGYAGDIEETGATFEENAALKAAVPASLGYIGLADDSGLCADALGGRPGVYSARYAGEEGHSGGADARNTAKLLAELRSTPDAERGAAFICVMACVFPASWNRAPLLVRGECRGRILREQRGGGGFGYDPVFLYEPMGKTFAELTPEEKNQISHRGNAIRLLAKKINAGELNKC